MRAGSGPCAASPASARSRSSTRPTWRSTSPPRSKASTRRATSTSKRRGGATDSSSWPFRRCSRPWRNRGLPSRRRTPAAGGRVVGGPRPCAPRNAPRGRGWLMLGAGMIDAAIVGGAEATLLHMAIAAFDRTGALSRRNEDYQSTPAPFDKNRDGLVMGEGAGALVLEREGGARARGATILAGGAGDGASADAFHITAPRGDGGGGGRAGRAGGGF